MTFRSGMRESKTGQGASVKLKKCKECKQTFKPSRPMQTVCSVPCAISQGQKASAKKKKAEDREHKAKLRAVEPLPKLADRAQAAVNEYVRLRDYKDGCISCEKPHTWPGQWHASHFRSRGAASGLRFHLWNIHKSCSQCNNYASGSIAEYTPRLIAKIGQDRVDWLKAQNQVRKYDRDYLERLRAIFAKKARRLKKRLGIY